MAETRGPRRSDKIVASSGFLLLGLDWCEEAEAEVARLPTFDGSLNGINTRIASRLQTARSVHENMFKLVADAADHASRWNTPGEVSELANGQALAAEYLRDTSFLETHAIRHFGLKLIQC